MFHKATQNMSLYAKIAYCLIISSGVLIPFAAGSLYYPMPSTQNQFELFKLGAFLVLTGLAFFFFALDLFLGEREVRVSPILYIALGYLAINITSFALSAEKKLGLFGVYGGYTGLVPTIAMVVFLFLTLQLMRNNSSMRFFLHFFVIASVFLAGYGLAQALGIEPANFPQSVILARRSFSLYGNPNMYAGYLSLAVFFAAGLFFTEKKTSLKVFYGVALVANVLVSLTSMSRSVWVALVLAGPLFIVFLVRQRTGLNKQESIGLGAGGLLTVGYIVMSLFNKSSDLNIAARISSIFNLQGSSGTRIEIWKSAVSVLKKYPLFGSGPDSFGTVGFAHVTQGYLDKVGLSEIFVNAHSLVFQLAATTGILGVLSFYAAPLYSLITSWKYAWENKDTGQTQARVLYGAVICGLIAFLINSSLSVVTISTLPFMWLIIGYLAVPNARVIQLNSQIAGVALSACAAAIALLSIVFPIRFIIADHYASVGATQTVDSAAQIEDLGKAIRLNPCEATYAASYVDAVGSSYFSRIASLTQGDVNKLDTVLNENYEKFPTDFVMQSRISYFKTALAATFRTQDLLKGALGTVEDILKVSPRHLTVIGDEAILYRILGNEQKAQELINHVKNTGPDTSHKQDSLRLFDAIAPVQNATPQ